MNLLRLFFTSFLWLYTNGETCPLLYQRYSTHHTYCLPPNTTCNIIRKKVDSASIKDILREHNNYRNLVATGGEKTYCLPQASNMFQLAWDEELASIAQKLTDQCLFQHDCNNCRKVQNFDVGQNLYLREVYPHIPEPNWTRPVKSWYDEVKDFNKEQIDSYVDGEGPPPTGHFTQLVWAETSRVGCGYTMYKKGNRYVELYACNYGPAGNVKHENIYKKGDPCSQCPLNSFCGKSSLTQSYPGLCQILGDKAPVYKPCEKCIFTCSFNDKPECAMETVSGEDKWKIFNTLSGSYLGIVLSGGENSTTCFTTPFKGENAICLVSYFRKGPQVAGQKCASTAKQILTIPEVNFVFEPEMKSHSGDFTKISLTLKWSMKTKLCIYVSVPPEEPPQYFELKDIQVTEGKC